MTSGFDSFYHEQWGERWTSLRGALVRPERQVARKNKFSDATDAGLSRLSPFALENCFEPGEDLRRTLPRGSEGLLGYYVMDPASIWIARALDVQKGDTVLDMCAAPGGKTLVLIEALGEAGDLLANEPSPARRERLMKVIQQYVPRDVRERVRVTGKEGGLFAKSHAETFDRILVDAPCSGERHLLSNAKEMENWSPRRTERLAQGQYALLSGALEALKSGGTIVYSTCSLSKEEDDEVVARFLKKKKERVVLDPLPVPKEAEATSTGVIFLPDRSGFGPLFAARFRKI